MVVSEFLTGQTAKFRTSKFPPLGFIEWRCYHYVDPYRGTEESSAEQQGLQRRKRSHYANTRFEHTNAIKAVLSEGKQTFALGKV